MVVRKHRQELLLQLASHKVDAGKGSDLKHLTGRKSLNVLMGIRGG